MDNHNTYCKRLIEVDLPIRTISEHARKDQNIRKGHLHNMHVWWATRPLASCRAVILAAMFPDPADPACPQSFRDKAQQELKKFTGQKLDDPLLLRKALLNFIALFSAWENGVNNLYLGTARKLVEAAHPEGNPMVLDPFAGAGSIPFEALRVGTETFAGDLNPVAVLINKVSQEYLPKYGLKLAQGVERWGNWVLEEARKQLKTFYPVDDDGNIPLAYIWARTIKCEGPGCGAEVPLIGMLWLSHKADNRVAIRYWGDKETKKVIIELFQPQSEHDLQQPIVKRFTATCPLCNYTTPYKRVREQLQSRRGGTLDSRLIAVIMLSPNGSRSFRVAEEGDMVPALNAEQSLNNDNKNFFIPYESTPECRGPGASRAFPHRLYNIKVWSEAFLPRQLLALGKFCELVSTAHKLIVEETGDAGYADAIATCLGLAVSNMSHYLTSLSIYALDHMISAFVQGSGMAMRPDFAEANPLMPKLVGGFDYSLNQLLNVLNREGIHMLHGGSVLQNSATAIPLPDDSISYVITDPPYYDAFAYGALSDLCYIWLKRSVGNIHPDLFSRDLTPKAEECILDPGPPVDNGLEKDKAYFELTMEKALAESRRVLQPDGVGVVIFAHKGTAGWEALLNSIINAGWVVTASWPIDTERATRMRAKNSSTLASSVHLVCRPREHLIEKTIDGKIGDWRDILQVLPKRIHAWMPRLAADGVVGADAIFACLGPALEIFSRYNRVEKASGEIVTLKEYLEYVWAAVAKEALSMIFKGADATGFEEDARLTAMWLWTLSTGRNGDKVENIDGENNDKKKQLSGGYVLEYDAARKIAQGLGAHLEKLSSTVEVKGDRARLLPVAERFRFLFGKEESKATGKRKKKTNQQMTLLEMLGESEKETGDDGWEDKTSPSAGKTVLDRLHQCMILFATGRGEALKHFLVEEGIGQDPRFWSLAQALSALYPPGSDEKRWVDGVLARKKGLGF